MRAKWIRAYNMMPPVIERIIVLREGGSNFYHKSLLFLAHPHFQTAAAPKQSTCSPSVTEFVAKEQSQMETW